MAHLAVSQATMAILAVFLLSFVVAIPKAEVAEAHEIRESQELFSLANATVCDKLALEYDPQPIYYPSEHYVIRNLFKRGCTLPQGGECYDGSPCCSDPNNNSNGWCCAARQICGDGIDGAYCGYSTVTVTETSTSWSIESDFSTTTESVAGATETDTITSTTIITVSESSVDVATNFVTVTVTRQAAKRAAPTGWPTPTAAVLTPTPAEGHQPLLAKETSACEPRSLFRRQQSTAPIITETSTVVEQSTSTTSGEVTETDSYTWTTTSTEVSTITFTSAINAKSTVTSTITTTVGVAATASSAPTGQQTTEAAPSPTSSHTSSGLSTGAKAGIGAGVGGAALLALVFLGFFLYRRRKNKQIQTAAGVSAAASGVGYGGAAMTQDRKSPVNEAHVPPPDSPYAGMIPVSSNQYQSSSLPSSTPAPAYRYPSPDEARQSYGAGGQPQYGVGPEETRHEMYARGQTPHGYGGGQSGLEVGQQQYEMPGYASPTPSHPAPYQGYPNQGYGHQNDLPEFRH
ncbi:hypothetical protein BDV96DRAFT_589176 [Lophiotrema nucula]|uniref:Mid2 domain-containing protein n=1 Tax=Lophiotrema nucula TaxID=690887 RepID=A0A6A5YJW2_9PLEO|nr:hypothetical protein BDV96DRAFT_589176 [Lophiotrema nucula]